MVTKKILFTGALALAITLSGCTQTQQQTQNQVQNEFSEVAQAIANGQGAYCEVVQEIDGQQHKLEYWIKDGMVKASGLSAGVPEGQPAYQHMISDGTAMYMWDDKDQGIKWELSEDSLSEDNQYEPDVPDFTDEQQYKNFEAQGLQVHCQKQNLTDEDFVPPTQVQFMSMESMMQNAFGQMKQEMMQEQNEGDDQNIQMMQKAQEQYGDDQDSDDEMDQEEAMQQYKLMMQQVPTQQ